MRRPPGTAPQCPDCHRDPSRGHLHDCPHSRAYKRAAFLEDVAELRALGETPARAAQRLDMTVDAVARRLRRYGMPWLAAEAAQTQARRKGLHA